MHTLDVKLWKVFEDLLDNTDKLNTWECDRLDEWHAAWKAGRTLSDRQLETLEGMYLKV
jgi:hypothetical protein